MNVKCLPVDWAVLGLHPKVWTVPRSPHCFLWDVAFSSFCVLRQTPGKKYPKQGAAWLLQRRPEGTWGCWDGVALLKAGFGTLPEKCWISEKSFVGLVFQMNLTLEVFGKWWKLLMWLNPHCNPRSLWGVSSYFLSVTDSLSLSAVLFAKNAILWLLFIFRALPKTTLKKKKKRQSEIHSVLKLLSRTLDKSMALCINHWILDLIFFISLTFYHPRNCWIIFTNYC